MQPKGKCTREREINEFLTNIFRGVENPHLISISSLKWAFVRIQLPSETPDTGEKKSRYTLP